MSGVTLKIQDLSGVPVLFLPAAPGRGEAADIVGAALEAGARWIAQKCVNYRIGLAVLGDMAPALERSGALRDWVRECNRGGHVWFLADESELAAQMAAWGGA